MKPNDEMQINESDQEKIWAMMMHLTPTAMSSITKNHVRELKQVCPQLSDEVLLQQAAVALAFDFSVAALVHFKNGINDLNGSDDPST